MTAPLIGLALCVAPLLVGLLGGVWLRRRYGRRRLVAALLLSLPPAVCLWVAHRFWLVGIFDALIYGGLLGLGLCIGHLAGRLSRVGFALALVSTLGAVAVGEAATRRLLPPPQEFPPAELMHFLLPSEHRTRVWDPHRSVGRPSETACRAIYGEAWPRSELVQPVRFPRAVAPRPGVRRTVLHVGDSMVFGVSVREGESFPELIEQQEPDTTHINGGIPGVGPDAYYAVTRSWLRVTTPDVVVFHLFVGNDVVDLDVPYTCCAFRSLLTYPPGQAPALRCPTPRGLGPAAASFRYYVENSPVPYALRVTTGVSTMSAHLTTAIARRMAPVVPPPDDFDRKLDAILRALRDELAARRSRLVVSILPLRSALLDPDPRATTAWADHERMRRSAEALGIPVVDSWDLFAGAVQRSGDDAWFVPRQPNDPHLNAAGNRLLADWLHAHPALHAP